MNDNDKDLIRKSFGKIKLKDEKKQHIYYEIQRNYDKKGFVSNQKLHFFKQRFDRIVPAVAAFIILVCAFAYYGVSTGLLTGQPYVATDKILADTGAGEGGKMDEPVAGGRTEAAAEDAPVSSESAQLAKFGAGYPATTANVYAGIDVGYTLYVIEDIPQDALVLWQEMENLNAVPADISLESYSISDNTLTLDFNGSLQDIQNASATTSMVAGIAQTYRDFYPEVTAVVINSAGSPVTFEGEEIDTSSEITFDITNREVIQYAEP